MSLSICVFCVGLSSAFGAARTPDRGLNLPPTQGTTRDGAFFPGLYQYEYQPDYVAGSTSIAGFTALRLAVNVETALDMPSLQRHKSYLDAMGGRGVICMFDTSSANGTSWPRTGRITDKIDKVANAWHSVHSVFASYGDSVMYEIFNEPWGYGSNATDYLNDMASVISLAGLPSDRVILAGLYGSADVQSVAKAGWPGYLAYHTYVFWLPEGQRTAEAFAQKIQQDLAGLSSRVFITEFGVGLDDLGKDIEKYERDHELHSYNLNREAQVGDWHKERPEDYDVNGICAQYPNNAWCKRHAQDRSTHSFLQNPNVGADVAAHLDTVPQAKPQVPVIDPVATYHNDTNAFLKGMRDGLLAFKKQGLGVRGLYHWHGWHNSDAWDFWDAANAQSSRIIQMMMFDLGDGASFHADSDLFMADDFVRDDQVVHIAVAHQLTPETSVACPLECTAAHCENGNIAEIGGKAMNWRHMVNQVCTFNASALFNGKRYCGAGDRYEAVGAIDCSGCARPARCGGLPCWGNKQSHSNRARQESFLQRRAGNS